MLRRCVLLLALSSLVACGSLETVTPTVQPTTAYQVDTVATAREPLPSIAADDSRSIGDPNAPVTIIEYSDFQCPFCYRYVTTTFPQLKQEYIDTGKVRYVFRNFIAATSHTSAPAAAIASLCAANQGTFWSFHDRLFAEPSTWSADVKQTPAILESYALDLGLNVEQFQTCVASTEIAQQLDDENAEARRLGAIGTPAFFVNDKFISGAQSFNAFKAFIENELAAKARGQDE